VCALEVGQLIEIEIAIILKIEIDTIIQIIVKFDNRWKNNQNRDYFSIISSIEKVYLKSKCALLCPNYVISLNSNANNFMLRNESNFTLSALG
jgi:hypothetical protein